MSLSDDTYQLILDLSGKGEIFFDSGDFAMAIEKYKEAFDLIPSPKRDFEASSWLLIAIGDCYFSIGDYPKALEGFKYAESCEGGLNPFIWLRIGQCYLEGKDIGNSREYLIRAYAVEGENIFSEENPKYLSAISDLIENTLN